MANTEPQKDRRCSQCGRMESEHVVVNFADADMASAPVRICPKALFVPMGNGR